jgi:hypothetical protein
MSIKKGLKAMLSALTKHNQNTLSQKNLTVIIDGKDCLAFGTAETTGLGSFQFFRADRARENFGEYLGFDLDTAGLEKIDGIRQGILDIKKLGETEELEYFIYLGLNLEKNDVTAFRLDGFQKCGKGSNSGRRNIIQCSAIENQAAKSGFDDFGDSFLKKAGIVSIDITIQKQDNATLNFINFFQTDFQTVIFFFIKSRNNTVIIHTTPTVQIIGIFSNMITINILK